MSTLSEVVGLPGLISPGFLQPKQKNKWRVSFLQFGGDVGGSQVASIPLTMQAKKVARPNLEFEKHDMHRYNSYARVLGKHKFGELDITFDDDLGSTASMLIQNQLQKQQFIIGAEGPYLRANESGNLYKFATVLEMLNGNDKIVERWTYEGCMITNYKHEDLDYSSSDIVTIQLTMSVDHGFQCFPDRIVNNYALGGPGIPCF